LINTIRDDEAIQATLGSAEDRSFVEKIAGVDVFGQYNKTQELQDDALAEQ
jgi:hypothetical protein